MPVEVDRLPRAVGRLPFDMDGVRAGVVAGDRARYVAVMTLTATVPAGIAPMAVVAVRIAAVMGPRRKGHHVDGVDPLAVPVPDGVADRPVPVRVGGGGRGGRQASGSDERRNAQARAETRENRQSSPHWDTTLL